MLVQQFRAEINKLKAKIHSQSLLIRELEQQAREDALTGLENRRVYDEKLNDAFDKYQRYGYQAAILLVDVNDFKQVNDTKGHLVGDDVLCHIANVLRQNTRTTDVVARTGGDEFMLLMFGITQEAAEEKANHLTHMVAVSPCYSGSLVVPTSVSIGVASFHMAENIPQLVELADKKMYEQKVRQKKNKR